jgi:hypothetical protein
MQSRPIAKFFPEPILVSTRSFYSISPKHGNLLLHKKIRTTQILTLSPQKISPHPANYATLFVRA